MHASSKQKLLIHIGAPKTGTTFLQQVFQKNSALLLSHGWLYPDASLRGYGHHDLAFLTSGGYPEWSTTQPRDLSDLQSELTNLVGQHDGSVLLSSENFYLLSRPEGIRGLLDRSGISATHELKIIVYLRRQDIAHESWYNQTVKAQGYTHSFHNSISEFDMLWDYEFQLTKWAETFGRDNLIVRLYDEFPDSQKALAQDFLSILKLEPEIFDLSDNQPNTGLNRDVLSFQRILNLLPIPTQKRRIFHKKLIELTAKSKQSRMFDQRPLIDALTHQQISSRYEIGNRNVAQRYFSRSHLFKEPPEQKYEQPVQDVAEGLTPKKLFAIIKWLVAAPS